MSIPHELFVRNSLSLAALVFVVCESIANFERERKLIWRGPIIWVKAVYVAARYSALFGSIINMFLLIFGPLHSFPNRHNDCRNWLAILSIISCISTLAIDGISAVRIFILYKPDLRIVLAIASLVITEFALLAATGSESMISSIYTPTCRVVSPPRKVLALIGWVVGTQSSLILLTLYKLKTLPKDDSHTARVFLVLRQGIYLCLLVLVLSIATLSYSLIAGESDPNFIALWPGVCFSCAICRVILKLRRGTLEQLEPPALGTTKQMTGLDLQLTNWITSASEVSELEVDQVICFDGTSHSVLRRRCYRSGWAVESNEVVRACPATDERSDDQLSVTLT